MPTIYNIIDADIHYKTIFLHVIVSETLIWMLEWLTSKGMKHLTVLRLHQGILILSGLSEHSQGYSNL